MKKGIHPQYGPVVFRDRAANFQFLTYTTLVGDKRRLGTQTIKWKDGKTYPLYDVDISSASQPFYTGKRTVLDTAGQVSKFEARYGKRKSAKAKAGKSAKPAAAKAKAAKAAK